jgi:hypothetical protein
MMMIIILLVIIAVIVYVVYNKKKTNEKLINVDDIPNNEPNRKSPPINPNFIESQFHADYMDVITSFNNVSPNQRQIFNINNVPCQVTRNTDVSEVGTIANNFITLVNKDIHQNVPLIHTVNSGWDEVLPEHTGESGWEKVQKQLGLPPSLYNKPVMNTMIKLIQFSDIIKYETENEIKYTSRLVIAKFKVKDKLVIDVSFVIPKGINNNGSNVIIENVHVIGYLTDQGLGTDRMPLDEYYYFDNLEKNNMLTGRTILKELTDKYEVKKKVMQERIDGMDLDTQEKYYNSPTPADYDTYKMTQTIYDDIMTDINNKKRIGETQ